MTGFDVRSDGALLFARFAYPPNALGLCGPDDSAALFQQAAEGIGDTGLRQLAQQFAGAWPYLELIAAANGIQDPLDRRVVEAYWLGNPLLSRVGTLRFGNSMEERFRFRSGSGWTHLAEALEFGARPHHNFHVFSIYPWVGLLSHGRSDQPLMVLDRCRIRWGRVVEAGDLLVVETPRLKWANGTLSLAPPSREEVAWQQAGQSLMDRPKAGDWVALHWDWACQVLSPTSLHSLRAETALQLAIANRSVGHPGPAQVLV